MLRQVSGDRELLLQVEMRAQCDINRGLRGPTGKRYKLERGRSYDGNRIICMALQPSKCGIEIRRVREEDYGQWRCRVELEGRI